MLNVFKVELVLSVGNFSVVVGVEVGVEVGIVGFGEGAPNPGGLVGLDGVDIGGLGLVGLDGLGGCVNEIVKNTPRSNRPIFKILLFSFMAFKHRSSYL